MEKITINKLEEREDAWTFEVITGEAPDTTVHRVTLSAEYWKKLTNKQIEPEELVRKSFEFLLEREPKEAILREFELSAINRYFPEYEEEIGNI